MGLKPSDRLICGAMTLTASLHTLLTSLNIFEDSPSKENFRAQAWILGSKTTCLPIATPKHVCWAHGRAQLQADGSGHLVDVMTIGS